MNGDEYEIHGSGIINSGGGKVIATQNTFGSHSPITINQGAKPAGDERPDSGSSERARLGIVTILPEETDAVLSMLRRHGTCEPSETEYGCYEGRLGTAPDDIRVTVIQALVQGNQSALAAVGRLRRAYEPEMVAVVGIAGAIHKSLRNGDVVIADQVIYYDLRKETDDGPKPRTRSYPVPAQGLHAINAFFVALRRMPARVEIQTPGGSRDCAVALGPIGSGDAVVASRRSWIRRHLEAINDKVLAVEMEGAGLAQAFYEEPGPGGWLMIRGISDLAGPDKGDGAREVAAQNAAAVLEALVPHLANGRRTP
ncbi:hypothetical protein ACGFNU_49340 [Spirillospora sp. NPDC048911]|uniref:5'-methylthioadenosine/S-adenosylhomocysteine nucleosidase family protein n=1 Tax=Spirillospora sp. NPDC048911 TaxID=3364527 RepID=UPI0037243745